MELKEVDKQISALCRYNVNVIERKSKIAWVESNRGRRSK